MPKASDLDLDYNNPLAGEDDAPLPEGAQHGEAHTRRGTSDALSGQGAKTRARNKEIIQGRPFSG